MINWLKGRMSTFGKDVVNKTKTLIGLGVGLSQDLRSGTHTNVPIGEDTHANEDGHC